MKLKNLLTHLTVLIKRNIKTGTSFMTAILLLLNTVMINAQNTYPELLNDQLLIHRFEGNFRNMINNALPCEQNPNIICLFKGGQRIDYDSVPDGFKKVFYKYNICTLDTNLVIKDTTPLPELFSQFHGIGIPFMMGKTCFGFVHDYSDAMYHDDYICRSLFIRQNTDNKELYTNLLSKNKEGWFYSPFYQFCDSNFVMYRHIGRNLTSEEFSIMKIDTCGEIIDSAILQMPYPVDQFELHYSPILYNDQMTIFHNTIDSSVMYLLNDDFKITGKLSFPLRDPMSYVPGTCSYINLGDTILIKTMDSVSNSTLYSEGYTTTEVFVHFIDLDNLTVKKTLQITTGVHNDYLDTGESFSCLINQSNMVYQTPDSIYLCFILRDFDENRVVRQFLTIACFNMDSIIFVKKFPLGGYSASNTIGLTNVRMINSCVYMQLENDAILKFAPYKMQDPLSDLKQVSNPDNGISVYPNPVTNVLNVTSREIIKAIEVFNPAGDRIYRRKVNEKSCKIPFDNAAKGTYLVKVTTAEGTVTEKIIKQ